VPLVRYFLAWASRRSLLSQLSIPGIPRRDPARILDEDERWHQLSRLLNDIALPADIRAAGAVGLLYGLPTARIRHLRKDHLREHNGQTHLAIGSSPVLVPPKVATILRQLAETPPPL
jgi:hypothetical protein